MKYLLTTLIVFLSLQSLSAEQSNSASSGGGKFGLGLTLFGPTGITGKYQMNEKLSIEGSLGFGFFGRGRFHLHGVFLYDFHKLSESLNLYVGGGLVIQSRYNGEGRDDYDGFGGGRGKGRGRGYYFHYDRSDDYENSLGVRVPLGLSWKTADKKFEISTEIHLNLFLTGRDGADLGLALAGRYYF